MKYRLKKERFEHPVGTICYPCHYADHGCARDDERAFGVSHRSMTLDPDGNYPFFTVPTSDLEQVVDTEIAP